MGWFSEAIFGKNDDASSDNDKIAAQPVANDPYHQASGGKVIPEVVVESVNAHCTADMSHMDLWLRLKNTSTLEVEVMEVRILGQSQGLNRFLQPGESHDCCIYKGSVPTNDAQHVAQVDYKIVGNGDYFESDHHVSYRLEDDNGVHHFIPEGLKLLRPIRDR
jgi:hypothetical protein